MNHQPSKPYKDTWSKDFSDGWSEGYTTALDELNYTIKQLIESHYSMEE